MASLHPTAPHDLPPFITPPGETDMMFVAVSVFFVVMVLVVGNLYLRLHALPERMAHRSNRAQFHVVAVLALIALLTHQTGFWIAALLLALVPIPDISTPVARIADALERLVRIAGAKEGALAAAARSPETPPPAIAMGDGTGARATAG
ncbi:hypothetical protein DLJ53_04740 [Acuticoccus sediminis]|uniref:Uncharacterized protein n=1 Tax=Acuticoccus sediminis TaxID=2184697 RepID=A0A8B2P0V8_9HYPH|nr:hypothetical protein [Acuticoccus sediminis]RAI03786.1 hypothetical protein DLJ53_04740 [Acuticoccus sediminis]